MMDERISPMSAPGKNAGCRRTEHRHPENFSAGAGAGSVSGNNRGAIPLLRCASSQASHVHEDIYEESTSPSELCKTWWTVSSLAPWDTDCKVHGGKAFSRHDYAEDLPPWTLHSVSHGASESRVHHTLHTSDGEVVSPPPSPPAELYRAWSLRSLRMQPCDDEGRVHGGKAFERCRPSRPPRQGSSRSHDDDARQASLTSRGVGPTTTAETSTLESTAEPELRTWTRSSQVLVAVLETPQSIRLTRPTRYQEVGAGARRALIVSM